MALDKFYNIKLEDYLAQLGIMPVINKNQDLWYNSPFREEKEPSFKINRKLNAWYDHGRGEGGNIFGFVMKYYGEDFKDSLIRLDKYLKGDLGDLIKLKMPNMGINERNKEQGLIIRDVKELSSPALIEYLNGRGVSTQLGKEYLKEVRFNSNGRSFFSLGFQNNMGGFELRNKFFKGASSPKDITFFGDNRNDSVSVFEGFFNFLSYLELSKNKRPQNFLILNSTSLIEKGKDLLQSMNHRNTNLFLDNDTTGITYTKYLKSNLTGNVTDHSYIYAKKSLNDLNDFLLDFKADKKLLQRKL